MSFSRTIAFRYLQSSRENRFFSWITILALLGLAIGVAALIVVLSVINGFEFELRNRFLQANAHIMAYRYPAGLENVERWTQIIHRDFPKDVKGVSPFINYETMIRHEGIMHGVLIRGIAPRERDNVQSIRDIVAPKGALDSIQAEIDNAKKGKPEPEIPGVILGSGLMGIMNVKVGDVIFLLAPTESRFSDSKRFKIVGTFNSGLKSYDNKLVILSLTTAQSFFRMGKTVTGLEIGLHDADRSPEVAKKMERNYDLTFREWQSFNRPLFEAMERERNVIALIVAMVSMVAGFNILTTVFVSVSQRQRDISVFKALGARNPQIMGLFLIQSICIGVGGSVVGAILAAGISVFLRNYPLIDLPEPYFLKSLPVHPSPEVYLGVSLAAIAICLVAGLYPAFVASRVVPTEGIAGTGGTV